MKSTKSRFAWIYEAPLFLALYILLTALSGFVGGCMFLGFPTFVRRFFDKDAQPEDIGDQLFAGGVFAGAIFGCFLLVWLICKFGVEFIQGKSSSKEKAVYLCVGIVLSGGIGYLFYKWMGFSAGICLASPLAMYISFKLDEIKSADKEAQDQKLVTYQQYTKHQEELTIAYNSGKRELREMQKTIAPDLYEEMEKSLAYHQFVQEEKARK